MSNYYTGIGSRSTPTDVLRLMDRLAERMAQLGWVLRSGCAPGADSAFQAGMFASQRELQDFSELAELYIPWNGFQGMSHGFAGCVYELRKMDYRLQVEADNHLRSVLEPRHYELVSKSGAHKLHLRNVFQVLGKDLRTPSKRVVAWTEGGALVGGTATALKLAAKFNIPVRNLAIPEDRKLIEDFLVRST